MGLESNNIEKNEEQNIDKIDKKNENAEIATQKLNDIEDKLKPGEVQESKVYKDFEKEQEGFKKNENKQDASESEVEKNKIQEEKPQTIEEKLDNIENSLQPKPPESSDNNSKGDIKEKEKTNEHLENNKPLSDRLNDIKDDVYNKRDGEGKVSIEDKQEFVNKMKEEYDSTLKEDRGNNLVPEKAEYLNNPPMSGNNETGQRYDDPNYKWPNNGGFEGKPTEITPKEGQQFDRLGNEQGRFVAPIDDGQVQPKENRGLPYHFVENNITDEPSYHQYEVTRDFDQLKDAINEFNNTELTPEENDEMRDMFMEEYNRNTRPSDTYTHEPGKTYDGQIADAFEEGDGGGRQWELPMSVESLKQLEMIKEVKEC